LGVSRQTLYDVLTETRPITANLARPASASWSAIRKTGRACSSATISKSLSALGKGLTAIPALYAAE
jgi:hypothetical protein